MFLTRLARAPDRALWALARACYRAAHYVYRRIRSLPFMTPSFVAWGSALAVFLMGIAYLEDHALIPDILVPVMAALHALPLGLAGRDPLRAWWATVGAGVVSLLVVPMRDTIPWPPTLILVALIVLYLVALRNSRTTVAGVWASSVGVATIGLILRGGPAPMTSLPGYVILTTAVVSLGYLISTRRRIEHELSDSEQRRMESETRQALLEERARIARELHDVVAHHMSIIAVAAESAPHRIPELPPEAKQYLVEIGSTAREGLTEMRRLLGVLRNESGDAERRPQPGVEDLERLMEGARRAGLQVEMTTSGTPGPLPSGVDLSAYRIIQEALSNAARHAPGATVTAQVIYEEQQLRIRVVNDASPRSDPPTEGMRHGLLGMRERVAMLGGDLVAHALPEGGYSVEATLPLQVGS